jgi:alpha-beta hydrolase superfamily lysophospholipase
VARTLLTWRIHDEDLVGTCHAPALEQPASSWRSYDVGVLLLNAGPAPRAGNSDLSVHVADRLALRGIPVFRFDFAGLGDSSGPTPHDKEAYWREVLDGRNDQATLALVRRIRREFNVSRLIVGGLCAAAVPALRTADRITKEVAGVILLEPALHLTIPRVLVTPDATLVVAPQRTKLQRALSVHEWLLFLTGDNRIARAVRPMRTFLLETLRSSVGHTLPTDANVALVQRWQSSLVRGVQSLVVVAERQRADSDLPRILHSLPKEHAQLVSVVRVPRTNHLLTSGGAREAVVAAIERWVLERFVARRAPALRHARES